MKKTVILTMGLIMIVMGVLMLSGCEVSGSGQELREILCSGSR